MIKNFPFLKSVFIAALLLFVIFIGCELPNFDGDQPDSTATPSSVTPGPTATPMPTKPPGLGAALSWVTYQLKHNGGSNGDLYSIWTSGDNLNSDGMVANPGKYWNLYYNELHGMVYGDLSIETYNHELDLGDYVQLNQLVNFCDIWYDDQYDSWMAVYIAREHGGSEYQGGLYGITVASGNGGIWGHAGTTLWVVIYNLTSSEENPKRCFLINAVNNAFVERRNFFSRSDVLKMCAVSRVGSINFDDFMRITGVPLSWAIDWLTQTQ